MVKPASRRAVLIASATTITGALGGCLFNNPEVPSGHLYVENMSTSAHRVKLVVGEGEGLEGNRIRSNWYRLPLDSAIQFDEVIEPGTTYTIRAHRPTVPPEDRITATVSPCEGNDVARDVSVRVQADGMGITPWGCDEEYTLRDLDYVDPDTYAIEPPEEARTPGSE